MINDTRYILKRVIIGLLIALILMLLRGTLFLQTHAKTTISGGLAIATPQASVIENYDNVYFTNLDYFDSYTYQDVVGLRYNLLSNYGNSYGYSTLFPDLNTTVSLSSESHGVSFSSFAINFLQGSNHLYLDKNYSIALKFTKDSNLDWYGLSTDESLYSFTLYGKNENDNTYTLLDDSFITIDDVGFYTYQQNNNSTNNGVFIINFHTSSDDYTYNYNEITLTSLNFSRYPNPRPDFSNSGNFFPSILYNDSGSTRTFINKTLYFIEGKLLPYGEWCTDDTIHIGCGITGNNPFPDSSGMDVIHDTDLEVFADLPTCDSLDIPCHINRVVKTIQDLFVRFGNFFREFMNNLFESFRNIFIPSSDYIIAYINDSVSLLREKLGFLEYPVELLVSLLNRFNSLEKETVISYPGFNYPGTDTRLIPAFTFDFNTVINDNSFINQIYTYYFILINGFLCLCFVRLCRKKLISIGLGG